MKRLILLLSAIAMLLFMAVPALAADADEAAAGIEDDGVFVEDGASTTETEIGRLVAAARNDGENLSIVVLAEEPVSGAVTFADAVVDRVGRELVIVIAPESVGYAGTGSVYTVDQLETALDAAFETDGDDGDFARAIVESLTGQIVAVPEPVTTTATPAGSSDGGGGSGFVIFIVIIVVLVGGFLWLRSRSKKQTAEVADNRIQAARAEVQKRIDDVANDLLDMEDEVRHADNARADRFYNQAGETYREVTEAFAGAASPQALIDLSNSLDTAIWQLDTAEAILDGTDLPERPEPRSLAPDPAEQRPIDTSNLPRPATYERRSTRRSSYGSGSSMMETLMQLGMAYAAGRSSSSRRRPSGGGLGGLFGGSSSRRGSTRSGSSGSPVPGPSGRSTSTRRSTSTKQGTGGRVRGGRSRRKR